MPIGFSTAPELQALSQLSYPATLRELSSAQPESAGFSPSVAYPTTAAPLAIDRYNCTVLSQLIGALQTNVAEIVEQGLKSTRLILAWQPAEKLENASQVVEGLLKTSRSLSRQGDLATDLLKRAPELFIDAPLPDPSAKPEENSRMHFLPGMARNLLRDFGREVDQVAGQANVLALNLSADLNGRAQLPLGGISAAQNAALNLINAQRALERFALAIDGPAGFRSLVVENEKSGPSGN